MLEIIHSTDHPFYPLISTDPVRPEIPAARRIQSDCTVFAYTQDHSASAILCCRYMDSAPPSVQQLFTDCADFRCAVFYSIWSLAPGHARSLILAARQWILEHRPEIREFITLSPPTDMARDFHLRNGAGIYRINEDTVNYHYESRNY